MVSTSIIINEDITLPFKSLQSSLFSGDDLILSLDKTYYKIDEDIEVDNIVKLINDNLIEKEDYKLPEDTGNDSDSLSVLRYYISTWLDELLDRNKTVINCVKLSNNIFVYLMYEEVKKRRKTDYNPVGCYLLYKSGGNIQFLKVKNALPEP